MKKLFPFLAVCLFVLVSCEPDPILSLDKSTLEFSADGGSQTVYVTANAEWTVTPDGGEKFCTVSPVSGVESGYITVTVQPNTTWANRETEFTVTCTSNKQTMSRKLKVEQFCVVGHAEVESCVLDPDENGKVPAEGGTVKLTISSTGIWEIKCDASDVEIKPREGGGEIRTETLATVPACPEFEGRTLTFSIFCETEAGSNTTEYTVEQAGGVLVYGGEAYHAVKMKDGKWWMTENLRYIPAGMTPSSDVNQVTAGIFYPIVYDAATQKAVFSTSEEIIRKQGYLYQSEVALGLKVGDITTVEQAQALEGKQGICPEGWHVPTRAEYVNLVGKSVGASTNDSAPYYDGANGSVVKLNEDGFNIDAYGAMTVQDMTKTTGSLMGKVGTYEKISSGFYCGSSFASVTYNTKDDASSGVKNLMFTGLMPMTNKATEAEYTCNGSNVAIRTAASLRCVKNN